MLLPKVVTAKERPAAADVQGGLLVREVFRSFQGEGHHAGRPAVFVRLGGCNLACQFCDTDFLESRSQLLPTDRVLDMVRGAANGSRKPIVVLTGGEPLLQQELDTFTRMLVRDGFEVHLETNGTLPVPEEAYFHWVTCSPKVWPIKIAPGKVDEFKWVISEDLLDDYPAGPPIDRRFHDAIHTLMPINNWPHMFDRCVALSLDNPEYRVCARLHQFGKGHR